MHIECGEGAAKYKKHFPQHVIGLFISDLRKVNFMRLTKKILKKEYFLIKLDTDLFHNNYIVTFVIYL